MPIDIVLPRLNSYKKLKEEKLAMKEKWRKK